MLNMLETNVQGHSKPFTLLLILNFGFWKIVDTKTGS